MRIRFRSVVALVSLLVLILTTMSPGVSVAAGTPMTDSEAIELLQSYGIVRGNPDGTLDLDSKLTRAQAAALFVRVEGVDSLAPGMVDFVPFTDAMGHWAAGEIALANRLGLMKGDGNGTFRPNADITYAEVLTVLLRIVQQEPQGPWSAQGIYAAAAALGFAPAGVLPTAPAIRGKMFWSLGTAISKVPLPSGETALHKYVDQTPPVLTLDQSPQTTAEQSVVISGQTQGASAVTVDGHPVQLDKATGRFSSAVTLDEGNNTIAVEAVDPAGNKTTNNITIQRLSQAVSLDVSGPSNIKVGTAVKLDIVAKDSRGQAVALTGLTAQMSGGVATFDTASRTLTALNQVGRGTLTLQLGSIRKSFTFDVTNLSPNADHLMITSVNDGKSPTVGKTFTVKVQVMDTSNRVTTDDYWRSIRLTATGLSSVQIAQSAVTTQAGVATFQVTGGIEGVATLTASSSDLVSDSADVQFVTSTRVILTASPTNLRPDMTSSATIRAYLQDELGRSTTNTSSSEIRINLSSAGTDGYLLGSTLTIAKGASSSVDSVTYRAGMLAGTAVVTGTLATTQRYSVQQLSIPVTAPKTPVGIQIVGPTANQPPNATPVTVTVQMVDSLNQVVTYGSYAFRVKVTTNNGETVTNGLPGGVTLTYPGTSYGPVDGDSSTVVGRTYLGKATLTLTYNKSGTVTLTPVLVGEVTDAYHPSLGSGPASASTGLTTQPGQVLFAGTPTKIALTVDSTLGTEKPGGAAKAGTTMRVHARVVDASGAMVPTYTGTLTITRSSSGNKVTRFSTTTADTLRVSVSKGEAAFDVVSVTSVPGFDVYTATGTALQSADVTVAIRKDKPLTPTIVAIRGVMDGDNSPITGYVGPAADYMDIQLDSMVSPLPSEPTYWVSAKVYKKGTTQLMASGVVVDLMSGMPTIRVPKSALTTAGKYTFDVVINDGAGDSDRSPDLGLSDVLNAMYSTTYKVTGAQYDAATTKLTLSTSGLLSTGVIAPELLSIEKGTNKLSLNSPEVKVLSISSASAVLQLNGLASELDPDVYNGTVNVVAKDGWFQNADGSQVAPANTGVALKPMAVITGVVLDKVNKRLVLSGLGFSQGTMNLDQFHVGSVTLHSTTDRLLAGATDTTATIQLAQASFDAINALTGPDIYLTAATGWLKIGTGSSAPQAIALSGTSRVLMINVPVNRGTYDRTAHTLTLTGSGFTGATLDSTKLMFKVANSRTAPTYRLAGPATVTVLDDNTVVLILSTSDASYFESTTGFGGKQVSMTTDDLWLVDGQQRPASLLSPVLFGVASR